MGGQAARLGACIRGGEPAVNLLWSFQS